MSLDHNDPEKLLKLLKIEAKPSHEFKRDLRMKLATLAGRENKNFERKSIMRTIFNKKAFLGFAAMAAVLVIAVLVSSNYSFTGQSGKVTARQGFGELPTLTASSGGGGGLGSAAPMAESSDTAMSLEKGSSSVGSGGAGVSTPSPLIVEPDGEYLPPKISYSWNGEMPEIPEELYVYKDGSINVDGGLLNRLARATKLDFLSNLSSAVLENITLAIPGTSYRYSIDNYGRFNVWSNQQIDYNAPHGEMSDQELIDAANSFLASLGIDTSRYGAPRVDDSHRRFLAAELERGVAADQIWRPVDIAVIYPFSIEGNQTVNWGGTEDHGLYVSINLITRKAQSANGIWSDDFQKSLYPTRAPEEISAHALRGGINPFWGYYPVDQRFTPEQEARRQQIDIELTNVRLAYIHQFKYDPNGINNEAFWIPVYVFDGSYTAQDGTNQEYHVMVPAIQGNFFDNNGPEILPMEKQVQ